MDEEGQIQAMQRCSKCSDIINSGDNVDLADLLKNDSPKCLKCMKKPVKKRKKRKRETETGEKPYRCDTCGKHFAQKYNLAVHFRMHTGERDFACTICGKTFAHKSTLTVHYRVHTGEKNYECPICKMKLAHKSTLNSHVKLHKNDTPKNKKGLFPCDKCGQMFQTNAFLILHKKKQTRDSNTCEEFAKYILDKTHTEDPCYICKVCGKKVVKKSEIRSHVKVHTQERCHACELCGKSFRVKKHLRVHMTIHTGDRRFMCDQCGQRFSQNSHLRSHKRLHSGEKFYCDECGRGFSYRSHLSKHLKIHASAREGSENNCNVHERFSKDKLHLTEHLKVEHRKEGEYSDSNDKIFFKSEDRECSICHENFADADLLLEHSKVHDQGSLDSEPSPLSVYVKSENSESDPTTTEVNPLENIIIKTEPFEDDTVNSDESIDVRCNSVKKEPLC